MSKVYPAYFSDLPSNRPSDEDQEIGEICIANISPYERQLRVKFAIRQFIFTLVILGVLITLQVHPLWRLFLQFLFSAATVSYIQARDKT